MSAEDYDKTVGMGLLDPAEIEALNEGGELSPTEKASLEEIVGEGIADDDEEEDDDEGDGASASDGQGVDDGAGGQVAVAAATESATPDSSEPGAPQVSGASDVEEVGDDLILPDYRVPLPEDFSDQMDAVKARTRELAVKFKDGDIDVDEYLIESEKIAADKAALDALAAQAEAGERMTARAAEIAWTQEVRRFMREVKKSEGIDYLGNAEQGAQFDTLVKALGADPKNEDKSFRWFLDRAHRATKAMLGVESAAAATATPKPAQAAAGKEKPAAAAARKPPAAHVPKTLAQVPGGDGPGDVGDEFAALDALDGQAYEDALARLTPAQRDRYLAQAGA